MRAPLLFLLPAGMGLASLFVEQVLENDVSLGELLGFYIDILELIGKQPAWSSFGSCMPCLHHELMPHDVMVGAFHTCWRVDE